MNEDPRSLVDTIVSGCFSLLLGALALYGAVAILTAIWIWICAIALICVAGWLIWHYISTRYSGW